MIKTIKFLLAMHKLSKLYNDKDSLRKLHKKKYVTHERFLAIYYTDIKYGYSHISKNNILYEFIYSRNRMGIDGIYIKLNDSDVEASKTLLYRQNVYDVFGSITDKMTAKLRDKIIEDVKELVNLLKGEK